MRRLYVYYRVDAAETLHAVTAASRWQDDLRSRHVGLRAELLRRPGESEGFVTLMETYAFDHAPVEPALQSIIENEAAEQLGAWLRGPRHVEVFEPCAW